MSKDEYNKVGKDKLMNAFVILDEVDQIITEKPGHAK